MMTDGIEMTYPIQVWEGQFFVIETYYNQTLGYWDILEATIDTWYSKETNFVILMMDLHGVCWEYFWRQTEHAI